VRSRHDWPAEDRSARDRDLHALGINSPPMMPIPPSPLAPKPDLAEQKTNREEGQKNQYQHSRDVCDRRRQNATMSVAHQ